MKKISHLIILSFFLCCEKKEDKGVDFEGIWIPQKIDWRNGNFDTFKFNQDSSFIILSSTQMKEKDSIFFQAEPGFILKFGKIKKGESQNILEITNQVLYRFITLPGDSTPSKKITEKFSFIKKENGILIAQYNGVDYIKTSKYTKQSQKIIEDLATNFATDLKIKYGIK